MIGYVEFVSAARVMGFGALVKGEAPSIERMIRSQNARVLRGKRNRVELPFPPLADMLAAKQQDFERGLIPDDLKERVLKWAPLKREAVNNG